MNKINWNILNSAFWIEIMLSYLLPFQVVDNFQYKVGVPIPYIMIYDKAIGVTPFMSMHLNPLGLLFNAIIIYCIISFIMGVYKRLKHNRT